MPEVVEAEDRDEGREQVGCDGLCVHARGVEVEREEADGDVEDFAGNLVPVDLWSLV